MAFFHQSFDSHQYSKNNNNKTDDKAFLFRPKLTDIQLDAIIKIFYSDDILKFVIRCIG